jgi:hypothetical protein
LYTPWYTLGNWYLFALQISQSAATVDGKESAMCLRKKSQEKNM